MTNIQTLGLITALTFGSAIALPGSCRADVIYGTWIGSESQITYEFVNGNFISTEQSGFPATFFISYDSSADTVFMSVTDTNNTSIGFSLYAEDVSVPPDSVSFGPQSASGSVVVGNPTLPVGESFGDFFLTYNAILPSGMIDTSTGGAVADMSINDVDPLGNGDFYGVGFQSTPEPASIVQVVSGSLFVAILAWMRRARRPGGAGVFS